MGFIDNISAELARLRRENDALRADLASVRSVYDFAALEARIAELKAALKPFAAWIDKVDTAAPSESTTDNNRTCLINGSAVVTYGDFRRAARALEQKEGQDQ